MRIHHHIRHIAKHALHATRIVVSQKRFMLFVLIVMMVPFISVPLIRSITRNPLQFRRSPLTNRFTAIQKNTGITATLSADKQAVTMGVSRKQTTASFAMALSDARATQDATGVSYQAQNGMSVRYQTIPDGIKEDIILTKHPGRSVILSSVSVKNAEPLLTPDGQIVFVNADGEYQFHIRQPYAVDASGSVTRNIRYRLADYADVYRTIKKDINQHISVDRQLFGPIKKPNIPNLANTYMLVLDMDSSWLNDPTRAYPITIDPTIVHDTSAEFATGQLNRVKDTGSGASPVLETDYEELPADAHTVGLWHMNEASGNILDSSGNSRTGTPTGTTVVAGKLGNARNFTGADDISLGSQTMVDNLSDVTVEAWVYPTAQTAATHFRVFSENAVLYVGQYGGQISFYMGNGTSWIVAEAAGGALPLNQWSHVGWVKNGIAYYIYLNGVLIKSGVTAPTRLGTTANVNYFSTSDGTTQPWTGSIDEVRISDVARTADEIKQSASRRPYATYTSDVIDLTGGTVRLAAWNSLAWTESGVTTGDGETLNSSTSLISRWNFNETSGTTADNAEGTAARDLTLTGFDSTASQDADPDSSWTSNNRRWGAGALQFDGVDSVASCTDANCGGTTALDIGLRNWSVSSWIKTTKSTRQIIAGKGAGTTQFSYSLETGIDSTGEPDFFLYNTVDGGHMRANGTIAINDGNWHYLVGTYDGTTISLYIDGKLDASSTTKTGTLVSDSTSNFEIGARNGTNLPFQGVIDSTSVFARALTASEILSNYTAANIEFQTRVGDDTTPDDGSWEAWRPVTAETAIAPMDSDATNWSWDNTATYMPQSKSDNSIIKMEGSGSMKLTTGILQADANTIGLWHMDETGGTGAYLKDTTANANNGTPTGTTIVNGISGKARSFDGANDVIDLGSGASFDFGNNGVFTHSGWVKPTTIVNYAAFVSKVVAGRGGTYSYMTVFMADGRLSAYTGAAWVDICPAGSIDTGEWQYVAFVYNGTTITGYVNGGQCGSAAFSYTDNAAHNVYIGSWYSVATTYDYNGLIDEVQTSNIARTTEEITESYRAGRDHYINRTISSTDLSGKTTLPFHIAANRPGTYLEATVGESPYANYQSDANTAALWHLDEQTQSRKDTFSGTTLSTWTETDPNANKIAVSNGLVLTAGTVAAWDSAIVSNASFTRAQGLTAYMKFTTSTGVAAPNHMMFGLANNATTASYANITHALYFNAGTFYVYQDGVLFGGPYGSGYTTSTTYEVKVALTASGTATYSVKGGVYTNWTTLLATDGTKSNTPLRVQVAQYQHTGTVNEIKVYTPTASVKDAGSNANNGTTGGTDIVSGKIGQAQYFNGTSDFISMADANSLDITANITLEAWIKNDTLTGYQTIVGKRDVSLGEYNYVLRTNGDELEFYFIGSAALQLAATSVSNLLTNKWYHVALTYDSSTPIFYVNGIAQSSSCTTGTCNMAMTADNNPVSIGRPGDLNSQYFNGAIDEVRISSVARTADEIRQIYEAGLRTHPVTIDFGAKLDSGNLITGSGDLSFTVDATYYGLANKGDQLFEGDKIIIRENYDGTEYIAQGTVTAVTASTGAVTVGAWDTGSTFAAGGYTANADVFKWQREYWNITEPLDSQLNAVTNITLQVTNNTEGRTIWLDDLRSSGDYLTTSGGSTITSSTNNRYFQYRMIAHSWDENVSSSLTSATLDYRTSIAPLAPTSLLTEGLTNPTDVGSITPKFSAIHSDPDSDNAGYYEIEVNNKSDFTGTVLWDTGQTAITPFASSARSPDITYAGTALALNGYTYYWRIRFTDIYTDVSPWSATATFVMTNVPIIPTLDSPANNATGQSLTPKLKTTTHDNDGDYLRYKIQLCTDLAMTTSCQTFDETASQTGWSGQNTQTNTAYTSGSQAVYTVQSPLLPATPYYWRSYAIDPAGTNTWNATQATPFSFTTGSSSPTFQMEGINMQGINVN